MSSPNDRTEYDATLSTRDALVAFYKAYNPAKLDNATIQTIIDGWYGREVELFQMLNSKYEVAPHQGTDKAMQRNLPKLPQDRVQRISEDSLGSPANPSLDGSSSWLAAIGSAVCCKSTIGRFSKTYYEVETQSPGFLHTHVASETPGQAMHTNLQSPALPPHLNGNGSGSPEALPKDCDSASTTTTEEDLESRTSVADDHNQTDDRKASKLQQQSRPGMAAAC